MSDLISREVLLERLEKEQEIYENNMASPSFWTALSVIRHMPTVKIVPQWTPCSERLPEIKGWYHCTCNDEEVWGKPIVRDLYYYPGLKAFVDNIRYEMNGLKDIQKYNWSKYVTAWMPLPQPYKGE